MRQKLSNDNPTADVHQPDTVPLYKFYRVDLRCGSDRRQNTALFVDRDRRSGPDRRQDADWRFSLIRRRSETEIHTRYVDPISFKRVS